MRVRRSWEGESQNSKNLEQDNYEKRLQEEKSVQGEQGIREDGVDQEGIDIRASVCWENGRSIRALQPEGNRCVRDKGTRRKATETSELSDAISFCKGEWGRGASYSAGREGAGKW